MKPSDDTPRGDLKTALQHAASLLQSNPQAAGIQAEEILKVYPNINPAKQILGAAYRFQGKLPQALATIEPLAKGLPNSAPVWLEFGLCLSAAGRGKEAIQAFQKTVAITPEYAEAWRALAEQLSLYGDTTGANTAMTRYLQTLSKHPELAEATNLFQQGNIPEAEHLARNILKKHPTDVVAMRLLADIGIKVGQYKDAIQLLERALELAPGFHFARNTLVIALFRKQDLEPALKQVDILLSTDPGNPNHLILKASILVRGGDHEAALEIYEKVLADYPDQARAQLNYGHTLKTVGRLPDSIAAYRACIKLTPSIGEAYWSLANLKTFRFTDEDVDLMLSQVTAEGGGEAEDQANLAFALGKAYEDRKEYENSFKYYKRGNAIRRVQQPYDAKINIYDTARQIKVLDTDFFKTREGQGCPAPDPIFIVGLPRAGSTLLEQILASHSQVEGTAELVDIIAMSRDLGGKKRVKSASKYPEILNDLSADDFARLGAQYLETTRIQRLNNTPFFIDKMPNNFQHIGLIHMILPNAKIIDARRHPMGGCFSGYKQLFARGQTFSYDLSDIGHYYRDYVKLMDHWDEVLPGRVHRVQYEEMVADTETQIRKLLDYCDLEFEEACLKFYETDRAVRTPSSEQVRQPIYDKGLEQWRHYEEFLGPLKEALGPVLDRYPI
ncbi:tetratricopeptide repeat-containing sulfotransferase family protein [Kordiimonas pumila]|uniref:Sulfotransferase n=1 Tax=Kordiimonas pumila TaxID=2161677 RepID=A0ABV7D431_9PROT|nr:tetratricopeptide repeat-containing sulfotransferase family protein [Kordiimonas pumila]